MSLYHNQAVHDYHNGNDDINDRYTIKCGPTHPVHHFLQYFHYRVIVTLYNHKTIIPVPGVDRLLFFRAAETVRIEVVTAMRTGFIYRSCPVGPFSAMRALSFIDTHNSLLQLKKVFAI